jgi:hypothetical protein
MNLGKLLAAGKSIMNGHSEVYYRACKQGYLPKFGSPKNPFKTEPAQPEPEPAGKETEKSTVIAAPLAPRAVRAAEPAIAVAAPVANVTVIAKEIPPLPALREKKKTNWASKLSPAAIFHRGPVRSEASPAAASGKTSLATQEELSLDSVKVVHNDLSDVDVEVVPIKSRPAPAGPQPAKKSWEALGEQLFGVKAT